jgi:hypothetical protein
MTGATTTAALRANLGVFSNVLSGAFTAPVLSCTCAKGLAVGLAHVADWFDNKRQPDQIAPAIEQASHQPPAPSCPASSAPPRGLSAVTAQLQELPQEQGLAEASQTLALRLMLLRQER